MKKVLCLLMIFIPIVVLADSAGPSIIGYDAIITNKNGAIDVNEKKNTIPYNSQIRVYDEYDDNGKLYAYVCYLDDYKKNGECWSSKIFTIKRSDYVLLKDEYVPKDNDS